MIAPAASPPTNAPAPQPRPQPHPPPRHPPCHPPPQPQRTSTTVLGAAAFNAAVLVGSGPALARTAAMLATMPARQAAIAVLRNILMADPLLWLPSRRQRVAIRVNRQRITARASPIVLPSRST